MTIINLIKITLFAKDFNVDDNCLLIFHKNVKFDTYYFDIVRFMISLYLRIKFMTSFNFNKFRHMFDLNL